MKFKSLLITFFFPMLIVSIHAETVYIGNYFLAKKLQEIAPGCIEDRELDTECTELGSITSLILNDNELDLFLEHERNLTGLEYLTELKTLTLQINKLSLEIYETDFPGKLEDLTIGTSNLNNIDPNETMVAVTVHQLPASIKNLTLSGGRSATYYFGIDIYKWSDGIEKIDANCYYLTLPEFPSSVKKLKIGNVYDLHKIKLNEGITDLEVYNHIYFFDDIETPPILPVLPASLKTFKLDQFYTYYDGMPIVDLDKEFFRDKFILNEGLESLTIQYAEWFKYINYPSTLKYIEYNNTNGSLIGALPEGLETFKYNDNYYYSGEFNFPSSLRHLELRQNGMSRIPYQFNEGLLTLDISLNPIFNFSIKWPSSLEEFTANYCDLEFIPEDYFTFPKNLKILRLDGNAELSCIPELPKTLEVLEIEYTNISCLPNKPESITPAPTLPFCTNSCGFSMNDNVYSGRVYIDMNDNWGFQEGDIPIAGAIIHSNHGTFVSDEEGRYSITTGPLEEIEFWLDFYHPLLDKLFHSNNRISTYYYESTAEGLNEENLDFEIYLLSGNDLTVAASNNKAKPGFDNQVFLTIKNNGTLAVSNARLAVAKPVDWTLKETLPPATFTTSDSIIWENISLSPMESKHLEFTATLPATSSILGQPYSYTAKVTPLNDDLFPENNTFIISDTVRGAYDPNDKLVYPTTVLPGYSEGERFIYTIRFQNTGNDTATIVYILDTIQSGLTAGSLEIINNSHEVKYTPLEGGIVRFDFPGIQLPDSTTNEQESQGFVTFSLAPEADLPQGSVFENRAAIYFDFNEPIITNTATVEVIVPTGIRERSNFVSKLYPNPARSYARIEWSEKGKAYVSLIDISGRIIFQSITQNSYQDLSLSRLKAGMYFVKVDIGANSSISKLIVE